MGEIACAHRNTCFSFVCWNFSLVSVKRTQHSFIPDPIDHLRVYEQNLTSNCKRETGMLFIVL